MYEDLSNETQCYLHALELREYYRAVSRILNGDTVAALEVIQTHLFGPGSDRWAEEIKEFVTPPQNRTDYLASLVPYYLAAGCGIRRICDTLQVGQARVYKVREQLATRQYRVAVIGMFRSEPILIEKLQEMLRDVNVLDGFRVLDPQKRRHNPFKD